MTNPALGTLANTHQRPSLERLAVRHLGHGPVLLVDVNDATCYASVLKRNAECLVFDSRPSFLTQAGMTNRVSFAVSAREMGAPERFASIILGAGVHEAGDDAFLARLTQVIHWLAPAGRAVLCVPGGRANSTALRAGIEHAAHSYDLQLRTKDLSAGDELVLLTKRAPRQAMVRWEGSRSGALDGSLAYVNEELTRLVTLDANAVRLQTDAVPQTMPPDIVVRHSWPPRFNRPQTRYYVHMQPWEFGSLLETWQAGLEVVDEVWCYTRYVADIYVRAGYPKERIHIIPLGFNPEIYFPSSDAEYAETRAQTCLFTFVGGFIRRKGADLAIAAYADAFTADDNVCLVIKGNGSTSFYSQQDEYDLFQPLRDKANAPKCVIVNDHLRAQDLAKLYRNSTALLSTFRGEGFGLPALEAMACGTPVIYTAGGAMDDFIAPELGYPIPSTRDLLHPRSLNMGTMIDDGFFLRPDAETLKMTLRQVYENRPEAWTRGARAALAARQNLTWQHAAKRVEFRLAQIAEDLGLSV